ncbi:MAG: FtsW/RodA/SpoVE family cell cycle protein [Candidatus Eremiobacteraeota bacterium]|nr:FtsW/RodA/SpoVE family cell cycle protein [Candidatus Eremiobacteraeota bacterium]
MLAAIAIAAFTLSLAPKGSLGSRWLLIALAGASVFWVWRQPAGERRDNVLPALAVLLSALGLVTIARLSVDLAHRQVLWLGLSLALVIALGETLDRFRRYATYKYIWVLASIVLFVLLALFGQEVNGAKLWIRIGPVQYEPVELIKLFIVFFMAAYLAETGDVIAAAKPWSLRANARYLGPLFLGWGASTAILVLQHDLGMAALLLGTFAAMLYVATRRIDLIVAGGAIFAAVALWAVHHYPYVATRVAVWRNPFADPLGHGYQTLQGLFALAGGGLFGAGYGLGHPSYIPDAPTDYILAAWAEDFGALGACVLLAAFALVVRRSFLAAERQPDLYAKLLLCGLAATLAFQVCIIVGGVLGAFPLTGITLPFFSYGGSSLVANFLLVSLVWAVGAERRHVARAIEQTERGTT